MKINPEQIAFIESVVKTGLSVNIDNVIIEPDMVRAIDDGRTVVLFHNTDVPPMPFGSVGLNRISVFKSRLDIAKTQNNFTVDVKINEDEGCATSIHMRGDSLKIDYRCANPAVIQAPRSINDTLIYRIQLNAEAVSLLQKGQAAMGSETVTIKNDDGVKFELLDVNSDVFSYTFAPDVEIDDVEIDREFTHRYPIKTLLALFKQNPDGMFEIGEKGILRIDINGLDVYVLPKV